MDGSLIQAAVPVCIVVYLVRAALRPVCRKELLKFVERFGVALDEHDEMWVAERLGGARRMRSFATAAGVAIAGLPAYLNLVAPDRSADVAVAPVSIAWLFAAAAAATAAELLVVQRPGGKGTAAVIARSPDDYVANHWPRATMTLSLAAIGAFGVAAASGYDDLVEASTGVVGAALALTAVTFGLRRVADRPRIDSTAHMRAVDDAVRAHGAHHLVGAALALSAVSLGVAARPIIDGTSSVAGLVLVVLGWLAFGVWYALARNEPRQVAERRNVSR